MAASGYQLLVYGNKRQDEVYCAKCERLIKKLGMQDHVFIMGLAKPAEILRQGWIYLQVRSPPPPPSPLPLLTGLIIHMTCMYAFEIWHKLCQI